MEVFTKSSCDSEPGVSAASPLDTSVTSANNVERVNRQISNIKKMLHIQKEEVKSDIEEGVNEIQKQLLEQLEDVFKIKLKQLKQIEEEARISMENTINPEVFYTSAPMRSLTSFDWLLSPHLVPSTLGYLKACEARPEHLVLVDNYSSFLYSTGDSVRVYYRCEMGRDPLLFEFLSCTVRDPSGVNVDLHSSDLRNGCYVVEFIASQEGRYTVYIRLYKVPIQGCPFFVEVSKNQDSEILSGTQSGGKQAVPPVTTATKESTRKRPAINKEFFQNACKSVMTYNSQLDSLSRTALKPSTGNGNYMQNQQPVAREKRGFTGAHHSGQNPTPAIHSVLHSTALEVGRDSQPAAIDDSPNLSSISGNSCEEGQVRYPRSYEPLAASTPLDQSSPEFLTAASSLTQWPSGKDNTLRGSTLGDSGTLIEDAWRLLQSDVSPATFNETHSTVETSHRAEAFSALSGNIRARLAMEVKCFQRNDHLRYPIGVSSTREGNIIVADTGNHRVLLFDSRGTGLCTATLPRPYELQRPSAVVCFNDGKFAVKDDVCIYMFSKHGEFIRSLGKAKLSRPYGLALDHEGMLVTLALRSPAELWRFDISGVRESASTYMPLFPKPPSNSKCRFLDVHEEYLFVADLGLSTIYKSSLDGYNVCSFGKKGKSLGQFFEPSGVSATEEVLFIGDSKNNRVQVFDFNGGFQGMVKFSSTIARPSGIYASSDDKLYVLNYLHGILKVFHLDCES
ncbi:uncharacterized protein LOC135385674 [Ornithodoros turicata]|uniref:uncharacterized protein LOC135385674 n=1 Tax=Ornithodoros turicata TaxID=34597 RepID=UPI00313892F3